jgi:hypothetical protein
MPLDPGLILDAYDTLREAARKRWLFGKPTEADLRALAHRTAQSLGITDAEVQAAVARRGEIEELARG